jgi:aminoglycoside phosphotransferase (APT) family kinase protein
MQQGWERRFPLLAITPANAAEMLRPLFPRARVVALDPLTGGLRNTLYRVALAGRADPVVLRLYTADPAACAREVALARLLAGEVPIPELLYADCHADPPYAVVAWCDGLPYTELIARREEAAIASAAGSAGSILARIQRHSFPKPGELGPALDVVAPLPGDGAPLTDVLAQQAQRLYTYARLGEELATQLLRLLQAWAGALEEEGQPPVLMHADYKPENLLVRDDGDGWRVAAVLDWEFACSAQRLFDPGLFLRRAVALPAGYAASFAATFVADSPPLPRDWQQRARLHDLVNLLDFLDLPDERPVLFADVRALIAATVEDLST